MPPSDYTPLWLALCLEKQLNPLVKDTIDD